MRNIRGHHGTTCQATYYQLYHRNRGEKGGVTCEYLGTTTMHPIPHRQMVKVLTMRPNQVEMLPINRLLLSLILVWSNPISRMASTTYLDGHSSCRTSRWIPNFGNYGLMHNITYRAFKTATWVAWSYFQSWVNYIDRPYSEEFILRYFIWPIKLMCEYSVGWYRWRTTANGNVKWGSILTYSWIFLDCY